MAIPADPAALPGPPAGGPAAPSPAALSESQGRFSTAALPDEAADGTTPAGRGRGAAPGVARAQPPQAWSAHSRELAQLLGRSGLGDRRAFAELYDRTSSYLFGVVLRIQRDRAVAEELLQEIYVTLWRQASGFDAARSQPLTWMTHIARNRAIDSLRRAEAQPRALTLVAGRGGAGGLGHDGDDAEDAQRRLLEALPDEAAGPLDLLSQASEARELGRCMERLSAAQRQSVALAFYDGLSHAEVAERLRQPLGTVKSWVRRALLALKSCLDRSVRQERSAADPGSAGGTGGAGGGLGRTAASGRPDRTAQQAVRS